VTFKSGISKEKKRIQVKKSSGAGKKKAPFLEEC